jgi:hypothetical protein
MRRMDRGFKDRFPRLPPGVTPSDIDRHFGPPDPPEDPPCFVCSPSDKPLDDVDSVDELPFCPDHGPDDARDLLPDSELQRLPGEEHG